MELKSPDRDEVRDTADYFDIDSDEFIIKDHYVTQAIHCLSKFESTHFNLMFCGGTCLSKGHQVTHRMSEDVDFKLYLKDNNAKLSKSALRKLCSRTKKDISKRLLDYGFAVPADQIIARVENQYICMRLSYPNAKHGVKNLRDHIKLEIRYSSQQHDPIYLEVSSLVDIAHRRTTSKPIASSVLEETTAEKWVALTRRLLTEYQPTSLRHVYDIHMILLSKQLNHNVVTELIERSIQNDANQFENKHAQYHANPEKVIQKSLSHLKTKGKYRQDYELFLEGMVFGKNLPKYTEALESVLSLRSVNP